MGKHDPPSRANMIRNKIVQPGPGHNDGDHPRQLSDSQENNNTGRISKEIVRLTGESTPKNYALPNLAATTGPSTYDEKKMQPFSKYMFENLFFLLTAYHQIAGHCLNTGHHTVKTEPSTEELSLRPEVRTPNKSAHKIKRGKRKLLNSGRSFSPKNGMGTIAKPDKLLDSQPNPHLRTSLSSGGRQISHQDPAPLDIDTYHFRTPFEQEGEIVLSKDSEMFGHEHSEEKGGGVPINNITKMAVIILSFVIRIAKKLFYEAILQSSIGYLLALVTDWKKHLRVRLDSNGKYFMSF